MRATDATPVIISEREIELFSGSPRPPSCIDDIQRFAYFFSFVFSFVAALSEAGTSRKSGSSTISMRRFF